MKVPDFWKSLCSSFARRSCSALASSEFFVGAMVTKYLPGGETLEMMERKASVLGE